VSAALQTPAGFLVDHIGARLVLMAGVALGTAAFAVAGVVNSYAVFVAMFAVAGLGNTAYHPANCSLLSQYTPANRIGQIFSIHTFAGIAGSAVAPATLIAMQMHFGWRGAFIGAAILGVLVLALLLLQWPATAEPASQPRHAVKAADDQGQGAGAGVELADAAVAADRAPSRLLHPDLGGLNTFLVVALAALYGTSETLANGALTALFSMNAIGVLIGGFLASRTKRHASIAALSLASAGVATLLMGTIGHSAPVLIAMISLSGLFTGIVSPSRDMLVRSVTPPGAFGRVFGFVSSGFNIGSMIAPMIYGVLMDHREPRALFPISAACGLLCIGTVVFGTGRDRERR
jgi:MFS transporter, FSR family, fosmidomycin resistance protein